MYGVFSSEVTIVCNQHLQAAFTFQYTFLSLKKVTVMARKIVFPLISPTVNGDMSLL